jgi:oxygen-independent coproporphyrinogen-3 oxidase
LAGESPTIQTEQLTAEERARETVGVQLRRSSGIVRAEFAAQTGFALDDLVGKRLTRLVEIGMIRDDGGGIALTQRGVCLADAVIAELL